MDFFISTEEKRLRSGWRLLVQVLLFLIGTILLGVPLVFFVVILQETSLVARLGDMFGDLSLVAGAPAQFLATVGSVLLARRFLDRRDIRSLGLGLSHHWFSDLTAGVIIAGPMLGVIFAIEWSLGWLTVDGFGWEGRTASAVAAQIAFLFVIFILVGIAEELMFRGYWLANLQESLGTRWALILSSFAFGLAHAANPGFGSPALIGLLLAGLLFAFAVLRTGNLWLAIGLHIGWNFVEGPILGYQVSGLEMFRLIEQQVAGPKLLTGGAFGPEAGLLLAPALIVGALLIYGYTLDRSLDSRDQLE